MSRWLSLCARARGRSQRLLAAKPGYGKHHFAEQLKRRWAPFGVLWTGDLDSDPIPIDLRASCSALTGAPCCAADPSMAEEFVDK